jgi:phosphoadenylylsulfate reductase (thioredoxin) (EC 1.8.4.8)
MSSTFSSPNPDISELVCLLSDATPQEVLSWAVGKYGDRMALASSFGAEDMVLLDMLAKIHPQAKVFTLDTGRLHNETYELIDQVQRKYPQLQLKIYYPQTAAVQQMVQDKGINLFYYSVDNRKLCCQVRKVEPLQRALSGLEAWVTGLRRDQTANRQQMQVVEWDSNNQMIKINPLINWTWQEVWQYIRQNYVPYNALHDRNFPSIGCAPCTRAVQEGEDPRAGRWWWEQGNQECGLHVLRS